MHLRSGRTLQEQEAIRQFAKEVVEEERKIRDKRDALLKKKAADDEKKKFSKYKDSQNLYSETNENSSLDFDLRRDLEEARGSGHTFHASQTTSQQLRHYDYTHPTNNQDWLRDEVPVSLQQGQTDMFANDAANFVNNYQAASLGSQIRVPVCASGDVDSHTLLNLDSRQSVNDINDKSNGDNAAAAHCGINTEYLTQISSLQKSSKEIPTTQSFGRLTLTPSSASKRVEDILRSLQLQPSNSGLSTSQIQHGQHGAVPKLPGSSSNAKQKESDVPPFDISRWYKSLITSSAATTSTTTFSNTASGAASYIREQTHSTPSNNMLPPPPYLGGTSVSHTNIYTEPIFTNLVFSSVDQDNPDYVMNQAKNYNLMEELANLRRENEQHANNLTSHNIAKNASNISLNPFVNDIDLQQYIDLANDDISEKSVSTIYEELPSNHNIENNNRQEQIISPQNNTINNPFLFDDEKEETNPFKKDSTQEEDDEYGWLNDLPLFDITSKATTTIPTTTSATREYNVKVGEGPKQRTITDTNINMDLEQQRLRGRLHNEYLEQQSKLIKYQQAVLKEQQEVLQQHQPTSQQVKENILIQDKLNKLEQQQQQVVTKQLQNSVTQQSMLQQQQNVFIQQQERHQQQLDNNTTQQQRILQQNYLRQQQLQAQLHQQITDQQTLQQQIAQQLVLQNQLKNNTALVNNNSNTIYPAVNTNHNNASNRIWMPKHIEPPLFKGTSDSISATDFIEKLELYVRSSDIPQNILLRQVLPTLFEDEAKLWYQCQDEFTSYYQFKTKFMKIYNSEVYTEQLMNQFLSRSQDKDEPITHYALVIRNFYKKLKIAANDETIINRITSKVCPKYVKYFCDKKFKNITDFEEYIIAINSVTLREKAWVPPPPPKDCVEPLLAWESNKSNDRGVTSTSESTNRNLYQEGRQGNQQYYRPPYEPRSQHYDQQSRYRSPDRHFEQQSDTRRTTDSKRGYDERVTSPFPRERSFRQNSNERNAAQYNNRSRENSPHHRASSKDRPQEQRKVTFETRDRSPSPASNSRRSNDIRCFTCGKYGHISRQCDRNPKSENYSKN